MATIQKHWTNLPTAVKYVVPISICSAIAIGLGIEPEVVGTFILAGLGLRLVEWGARARPLLELDHPFEDDTYRKRFPPLAFDADAIIAAEISEAQQLRKAELRLPNLTSNLQLVTGRQPGNPIRVQADARHDAALSKHGEELRSWLDDYAQAADKRYRTFHLPLSLVNRARSAAAEDVRVLIQLGEDARFFDPPGPMQRPPACPEYETSGISSRFGIPSFDLASIRPAFPLIPIGRPVPDWNISRDSRTATFDVPRVHAGDTIELSVDLYVQVRHHGDQEVEWTISSTSGASPRNGKLTLSCPVLAPGAPITRLAGLLRYPDVDLEGEEHGETQRARREDPPTEIYSDADTDLASRLRLRAKRNQLEALGIPVSEEVSTA